MTATRSNNRYGPPCAECGRTEYPHLHGAVPFPTCAPDPIVSLNVTFAGVSVSGEADKA